MTVILRPATLKDETRCRELLALLGAATGESVEDGESFSSETFQTFVKGKRGSITLAEEDGDVLGMAVISYGMGLRYDGEYCNLEELIVDPKARGKNIGGLLVQETLRVAREKGCKDYGLYLIPTTEKNLPFYAKYGFERIGSMLRQAL